MITPPPHSLTSPPCPTLALVVPCFNEEAVLPVTCGQYKAVLRHLQDEGKISPQSHLLFVDDGSTDTTWSLIKKYCAEDACFFGISLSRNFGHQHALLAGLMEAKDHCDITISIDCDGQDDIQAIAAMVDSYRSGNDIVYGVRSSRKTDSFFKRFTAETFYRFLRVMGTEVVFNHADYRLMSSRALQEFASFTEVNLFLRGLIPLVGFSHDIVYYERHDRLAGKSHYPLKKMIALACNGITSLSIKPIRIISALGTFVALLSFVGILYSIIQHVMGHTVSGWASMTCLICFFSGIQLISLGIIGEYIGKTYLETKRRPRYIIRERASLQGVAAYEHASH